MKLKLYRELFESLSISRNYLVQFAEASPNKYKVYTIPKRTSGHRVIAHPSKELKIVQKHLTNILSETFLSHEAAYAYKKGLSIKDNAEQHLNTKYLLKMDFSDFFNSITPDILFQVCHKKKIFWSKAEERLLVNLLFWNKTKSHGGKLVLSVGAPSSPLISNFVMYDFDSYMSLFCKENKINYTRYADDITFSTNRKDVSFSIPKVVKNALKEIYDNLISINDLKTVFSSKKHNRHITGVTLTNDNKLSIGREKKRMISSLIHKYKIGILNEEDAFYLQGLLSFTINIEPSFIERMKIKYSEDLINNILRLRVNNEK